MKKKKKKKKSKVKSNHFLIHLWVKLLDTSWSSAISTFALDQFCSASSMFTWTSLQICCFRIHAFRVQAEGEECEWRQPGFEAKKPTSIQKGRFPSCECLMILNNSASLRGLGDISRELGCHKHLSWEEGKIKSQTSIPTFLKQQDPQKGSWKMWKKTGTMKRNENWRKRRSERSWRRTRRTDFFSFLFSFSFSFSFFLFFFLPFPSLVPKGQTFFPSSISSFEIILILL